MHLPHYGRERVMTDIEISRALALAIGWEPVRIFTTSDGRCAINRPQRIGSPYSDAVYFDYRDPAVIWPIAERYGCFPSDMVTEDFGKHQKQGYPDITGWEVIVMDYKLSTPQKAKWLRYTADTAAKAVALAVIGSAK